MFDAEPISRDDQDSAAERTARHQALLRELAEIGMTLARDLPRQAEEPRQDGRPRADLGLVFSRLARAIGQTLALEARVAEEGLAADQRRSETRQAQETERKVGRERRRNAVQEILADALEDYAAAQDFDEARLGNLFDDLFARGDDFENDPRPIGEIVAEVCAALGVTVDWDALEDLHLGREGFEIPEPSRRRTDHPTPPSQASPLPLPGEPLSSSSRP